jgi:hypothetical protein
MVVVTPQRTRRKKHLISRLLSIQLVIGIIVSAAILVVPLREENDGAQPHEKPRSVGTKKISLEAVQEKLGQTGPAAGERLFPSRYGAE